MSKSKTNAKKKERESFGYEPLLLDSPVQYLRASRSGSVEIKTHTLKKGEKVYVVGLRQGILRGKTPAYAILKEDRIVRSLVEDEHGVWMTDLPEELNQITEMLHEVKPRGKILVGGLGLGCVAERLAQLGEHLLEPLIVDVVERSKQVIDLCGRARCRYLIEGDVLEYLRNPATPRYDFYLLDTWQGTNEDTWWSEVVPQRRAIRQRWGSKPKIHCWAEDIMLGQVARTATNALLLGHRHWYYEVLPSASNEFVKQPELAAGCVAMLTQDVGSKDWEKLFGRKLDQINAARRRREREEEQ